MNSLQLQRAFPNAGGIDLMFAAEMLHAVKRLNILSAAPQCITDPALRAHLEKELRELAEKLNGENKALDRRRAA